MNSNGEIYHQAEIDGNKLSCFICLIAMIMFMGMYILFSFGILEVYASVVSRTLVTNVMVVLMTFCYILGQIVNYDKPWLKYVLLFSLLIMFCCNYAFVSTGMHIVFIIPLILSCRYYDTRLIFFVLIFTLIFTYFSITTGAVVTVVRNLRATYGSSYDESLMSNFLELLKTFDLNGRQIALSAVRQTFAPVAFLEILVFMICSDITNRGKHMISQQAIVSIKNANVEKELSIASNIQLSMLPTKFPPFPERKEFDIYASMIPAKEVGGDLYDFFMINDNKIAILIGDVSGKGVPAAMFMVRAKTLIKDHTLIGNTPSEIFTIVNSALCEGNKEGLFVTAFLGIIDIKEKSLTYVNAGHNPPLLKRSDGDFQYLKVEPGFILAGLDDFQYNQGTITFGIGDRLLLYTDGITEARNEQKELYGEDKLLSYVNQNKSLTTKELIDNINDEIKKYENNLPQYDDKTLLLFDYKVEQEISNDKLLYSINKTFKADIKSLKDIVSFSKEFLLTHNCDEKTILQILIAIEELFGNICMYAYSDGMGTVDITLSISDTKIEIVLIDTGKPFNIVDYESPNIKQLIELDDKTNDLGIFIVKRTMDKVCYKRNNNQNIVTLTKNIKNKQNENIMENNHKEKILICPATLDSYKELIDFVKNELTLNNCPPKIVNQILVAVDELYSNVVIHGYPNGALGKFKIKILCENNTANIVLIDDAVAFNPLETKDPDITLSSEEREIGGLGIYIVKETMDEFLYKRENNQNVVTIVKKW